MQNPTIDTVIEEIEIKDLELRNDIFDALDRHMITRRKEDHTLAQYIELEDAIYEVPELSDFKKFTDEKRGENSAEQSRLTIDRIRNSTYKTPREEQLEDLQKGYDIILKRLENPQL